MVCAGELNPAEIHFIVTLLAFIRPFRASVAQFLGIIIVISVKLFEFSSRCLPIRHTRVVRAVFSTIISWSIVNTTAHLVG